jgi:hypothetical protein
LLQKWLQALPLWIQEKVKEFILIPIKRIIEIYLPNHAEEIY